MQGGFLNGVSATGMPTTTKKAADGADGNAAEEEEESRIEEITPAPKPLKPLPTIEDERRAAAESAALRSKTEV